MVVGGITGNGSLGLNLVDNGSIHDLNGDSFTQADAYGSFSTQATYATGLYPISVVSGHLTGDGVPDLVIANRNDNDVSVLLNNGNFTGQDYTLVENTTTTLVSSANPSTYGQTVTFTATVTPQFDGTPTGSVEFFDNGTLVATSTLTGGVASLSTSSLLAQAYANVSAQYQGDGHYITSTSAEVAQWVNQASTATALSSSNDSTTYGQSVTFTATVAQQYTGTPTGLVEFFDNAMPLGTSTVTSGVVTFSLATLSAGTHAHVTAQYEAGQPQLTGSVAFYDGTTLLGTEPVSNGIATLNVGVLAPGTHAFSAVYSAGGVATASGSSEVVVTAGPSDQAVNTNGPAVVAVRRYGFHSQPAYLVLSFTKPLDPASAQVVSNYVIAGPSHHRGTASRGVTVSSAVYDPATNTVILTPARRLNVHWTYRLTVKSGVTSAAGVQLDGAGNGGASTDYTTTISYKNLAGRSTKVVIPGSATTSSSAQTPALAATSTHVKNQGLVNRMVKGAIRAFSGRSTH